jgi:pimeloyl-ACP methyl ester carboxylesterase
VSRSSRGAIRCLVAFAGAIAAAAVCSGASASPASPAIAAPASIKLGSQTLSKCAEAPLAYCGSLPVPLDHAQPTGPQISISFRWYPATGAGEGHATHTVVPVEGGPGYPSIESVSYRSLGANSGYSAMYGSLLEHSNMLAVDNRGTGESTPLKCAALQGFQGPTGTEAFQRTTATCAEALDHRWKYANGSWVQAANLFGSTPAAADMAEVIEALQLAKVDLYGDSYGSFFAQVFAAHFTHLVRSVTLDSTYQTPVTLPSGETDGLDPWYRSTVESMPADFEAACKRSQACAAAELDPVWARLGELAQRLRESPIASRVPGPDGKLEKVEMNVVGLVDLVSDAAEDTKIYGELDAAARALLGPGADAAPLLRLYAQREHEDEGYFNLPVSEYSVELYVADACADYRQLFDVNASPAVRAQELAVAEAALPAATFSPFSTAEWISQNENTEAFTACLDWPSPNPAQVASIGAAPLLPASLPVLVLGGEFDTWTPPVDVTKPNGVLVEIGGHARFVELANSTHVVGEGDTECGSSLVQRFVAHPQAIDSLDSSCAPAVPPIHAVGVYAASLAEQPPLTPAPGSGATPQSLQLAAAAVATAGDAIARYEAIEAKHDRGLEGGSVTVTHNGSLLTLSHDRLVPGMSVSGTIALAPSAIASDGEDVVATLTASARGAHAASLTATWTTAGADAQAQVSGNAGKQSLAGSMPAP